MAHRYTILQHLMNLSLFLRNAVRIAIGCFTVIVAAIAATKRCREYEFHSVEGMKKLHVERRACHFKSKRKRAKSFVQKCR